LPLALELPLALAELPLALAKLPLALAELPLALACGKLINMHGFSQIKLK